MSIKRKAYKRGKNMHEKLVKQLRNTEHCSECSYDKDCNEFDSCLMDLFAADAIEDMSKRIARQEKELQEKDKYIENEEYLFGEDWETEYNIKDEQGVLRMAHRAASNVICKITSKDRSGKLLYYFAKHLQALSKLLGYKGEKEYRFYVVTEDEYRKLRGNYE